jgi:hypothetical protein
MRFLPQISLRNLRKLDCYANRYPPTDQVRGHASLENAIAAFHIARRQIGVRPSDQTTQAVGCVTGFRVEGFSTCPHRRHSRRASILTMFMPHFGQGGRTSKQVKARLSSLGGTVLVPFRRQTQRRRSLGNRVDHCHPGLKCRMVGHLSAALLAGLPRPGSACCITKVVEM